MKIKELGPKMREFFRIIRVLLLMRSKIKRKMFCTKRLAEYIRTPQMTLEEALVINCVKKSCAEHNQYMCPCLRFVDGIDLEKDKKELFV